MNHSQSEVASSSTKPVRVIAMFCVVRSIVALIFLAIGVGLTAAQWLASDGDAATPSTLQRQ